MLHLVISINSPLLTWRDLQYIIAMTANHENLDGQWVTNGAGYEGKMCSV